MEKKSTTRLRVNLESASQEEAAVQAVDSLSLKVPPSPAMKATVVKLAPVVRLELTEATVEVSAEVVEVKEAKTANVVHQKMQLLEKLPSLLIVK